VTKIEASYKLAQTLDEHSYENVIGELSKSADDNSQAIAEAMRERQK
jgi:predicted FMN-binding regulatory protein PaiB